MVRLPASLKVTDVLLLTCVLLTHWRVLSSRDSFNGGRKALELATSLRSQNDVWQMLTIPSSVCRIVHRERDKKYCFGVLLSSKWLLTTASCALTDKGPSDNHFRVVCGTTISASAFTHNEFDVVEVKILRSTPTGERRELDIALLKLDIDAPGPFVNFEESDGPDFYILEQNNVMKTFFNVSDLSMEQAQGSWNTSNFDLRGLPLLVKPSATRYGAGSEYSLSQTKTPYVATSCRLYEDGVNRCTFSRITPWQYKSTCHTTGICNEVPSASGTPSSFHRSLSSSEEEKACYDPSSLYPNAERRMIPPFEDSPRCSDETVAQPDSTMATLEHLKALVKEDDALAVNESIACTNFDFNRTYSENGTLLHNAAYNNANKTAKVLCELGINTEIENAGGDTALLSAAKKGNPEVLKVIVNSCKNVNVNATDNDNKTALYYTAVKNSSPMAQVLCNASIDTEIKSKGGRTALLAAAFRNNVEPLKVILDCCKNVNVNATDKLSKTALHYSAFKNLSRVAQVLCHASIGLELKNRNGKTALILAANKTSYETLKVIVNCGANVNARDDNKRTALHHAAMSCNYDEAEFLWNHYANCSIVDSGNHIAKDLIPTSPKECRNETATKLRSMLSTTRGQTAGETT